MKRMDGEMNTVDYRMWNPQKNNKTINSKKKINILTRLSILEMNRHVHKQMWYYEERNKSYLYIIFKKTQKQSINLC